MKRQARPPRRRTPRPVWFWPATLVAIALAARLVLPFLPLPEPEPESLEMRADLVRAVDADTLAYGDFYIRLGGIAAPEFGHPAYDPGRRALGTLVRGSERIVCEMEDRRDRYGRWVGRCFGLAADGTRTDLLQAMVTGGHARACLGWGDWRYLRHENARSLGLPFPSYCWPGNA